MKTNNQAESSPLQWFAVYTKSRHEKKVAAYLAKKKIEAFLPLRTVTRRWKDRKKEIEIPIFSGYIFVRITGAARLPVLQTAGVLNFVSGAQGPIPIPDQQVESIQRLVASGLKYDPYPYLKQGTRVAVVRGPLTGLEGVLIAKRKKKLLVLSVDLIQQSTALEVDISDTDVV